MKCAWKVTWKWIEPPGRSWKRSKLVQPPWYQDNWIKYIWSNTIPIQMDCPCPWYHVGFQHWPPGWYSSTIKQSKSLGLKYFHPHSEQRWILMWAVLKTVAKMLYTGQRLFFNHQIKNDKFMMNTILNENIVSLILDKPAKHPPSFHLRLAS